MNELILFLQPTTYSRRCHRCCLGRRRRKNTRGIFFFFRSVEHCFSSCCNSVTDVTGRVRTTCILNHLKSIGKTWTELKSDWTASFTVDENFVGGVISLVVVVSGEMVVVVTTRTG